MMGYRRAAPVEHVSPNFMTTFRRPIELESGCSKLASDIRKDNPASKPI
jgi:hypothetical protein